MPAREAKVAGWHARNPKKMPCTCRSTFQDKVYGGGLRLHAATKQGYRCTVCRQEKY